MSTTDSADRKSGSAFSLSFSLLVFIFAVTLVLPALWPLLRGERSFFLRDIGTTHRPAWALFDTLGFARMNPAASFGQPYRGNPSLLVFYPFPKSGRSLDLHIVIHLMLLLGGSVLWLRRLTGSNEAAALGAAAFTFSGYVLSASSSINALTTIAWIPWVLHAAMGRSGMSPLRRELWQAGVLAIFSISGEPALILLTLPLALALAWRATGISGLLRFIAAGAAVLLVTLPIHRHTLEIALESNRVVRGFGFRQAMGYSLHPARLLETIVPSLFGDPSHILRGGWWGYEVSRGLRPYAYSIALGILPATLAFAYGLATRFRKKSGWWLLLMLTFIASLGGYLPGARVIWDGLPILHVFRHPIKMFLFSTLAMAVLAAAGFEYLRSLDTNSRQRRRVALWLGVAVFAASFSAIGAAANIERIERILTRLWWREAWLGDPSTVLRPIAASIAPRCFAIAALLLLLFFWVARRRGPLANTLVIGATIGELLTAGRALLPTVETRSVMAPTPIATAARSMKGRVFERAGKDLDAPVYGLLGRYPRDDARFLAVAQARQAWALYGAISGLRYGYDRSPDGSYSWRNHLIEELLEQSSWRRRLKWLRAAGVGAVIASNVPEPLTGLRPVLRDDAVGVPVTLYALEPALPELRSVERLRLAVTPEQAIRIFERPDFDEQREVVVEGALSPARLGGVGSIRLISERPDHLIFQSDFSGAGIVFLARTYSRHLRANAGGKLLRVFPANVHLCAIEVPAGSHRVRVTF